MRFRCDRCGAIWSDQPVTRGPAQPAGSRPEPGVAANTDGAAIIGGRGSLLIDAPSFLVPMAESRID